MSPPSLPRLPLPYLARVPCPFFSPCVSPPPSPTPLAWLHPLPQLPSPLPAHQHATAIPYRLRSFLLPTRCRVASTPRTSSPRWLPTPPPHPSPLTPPILHHCLFLSSPHLLLLSLEYSPSSCFLLPHPSLRPTSSSGFLPLLPSPATQCEDSPWQALNLC